MQETKSTLPNFLFVPITYGVIQMFSPAYIIPADTYDIPHEAKQLYTFSVSQTYRPDTFSIDVANFELLSDFVRKIVDEEEDTPKDIAQIINNSFFELI